MTPKKYETGLRYRNEGEGGPGSFLDSYEWVRCVSWPVGRVGRSYRTLPVGTPGHHTPGSVTYDGGPGEVSVFTATGVLLTRG